MSSQGLMPLKLAVISDLHIGDARGRDLYPDDPAHLDARARPQVTEKDYIRSFVEFVTSRRLNADYLIVPGDVACQGKDSQVTLGSKVLLRCAEALSVPEERIIFVPGNHDVDWSRVTEDDQSAHLQKLRFYAFRNEELLFHRLASRAAPSPYEPPFYSVSNDERLLVASYNTAWHDGPNENVHYGYIDPEHVKLIAEHLDALPYDPKQLRLFVLHHHLAAFSDPTNYRDFSALQNAELLTALLFRHRFDLVIHGHTHIPRLRRSWEGYGHWLAVLCAGSFSAIMFPGWHGTITNHFHLVHVDGRPNEGGPVQGHVDSWAYSTAHGWTESRERYTGIAHQEGFGRYEDLEGLQGRLRPLLETLLDDEGFVEWKVVVSKEPWLAYVPQEQLRMALDQLSFALSYRLLRLEEEQLMLVRRRGEA